MSKKQIRLTLACTVMLPVWGLIAFALFIFPGCITFFLAPLEAVRLLFKLWLKDGIDQYEREEIITEIKDCAVMMFAPIAGAYIMAHNFVKDGDLSLG
jgi:hypothetical protein